ncbi:MAG TPA: hypothetical protein VK066_29725 [Chloroflexota bacterium]|nr:hypothetical protein [Chloroflexota bacterium]
MQKPSIVVRRDGCTFCCLPLLVLLGLLSAGLGASIWVAITLLLH